MMEWIIGPVLLLAAGGLAAWLIIKRKKRIEKHNQQFDFTTKSGLKIKLSEKTSGITQVEVEEWEDSVVDFWKEAKGWDAELSRKMLGKIEVFVLDETFLNRAGIKVNGITYPGSAKFTIEMASLYKEGLDPAVYTPYKKVKSLFRHEVSHVLASTVGRVPFNNEVHHKLFADVGLGA